MATSSEPTSDPHEPAVSFRIANASASVPSPTFRNAPVWAGPYRPGTSSLMLSPIRPYSDQMGRSNALAARTSCPAMASAASRDKLWERYKTVRGVVVVVDMVIPPGPEVGQVGPSLPVLVGTASGCSA